MAMKKHENSLLVLILLFSVQVSWSATAVTLDGNASDGFYGNIPAAAGDYILTLTQGDVETNGINQIKIYDNGGSSQECSGQKSVYYTIAVPEGYILQVTGTFASADENSGSCGQIDIYDGGSNTSDLLFDGGDCISQGESVDIGVIRSTGDSLTIYNRCSDHNLELDVSVLSTSVTHSVTINNPAVGGTAVVGEGATVNSTVSVTLQPAEGFLPKAVSAISSDNTPVKIDAPSSFNYTVTFTMPYGNVDVSPEFTDDWTVAGGLFVNVPTSGTETHSIPDDVTSFGVYNREGVGNGVSENSDGIAVLNAPEGKVMKITGLATVNRYSGGSLVLYRGDASNRTQDAHDTLRYVVFSGCSDASCDMGTTYSYSNTVSVRYNAYYNMSVTQNLALTVELLDASVAHNIAVATPTGGTVESDVDEAVVGQVVTLTVKPNDGYILGDIEIVANGENLQYSRSEATPVAGAEEQITFEMPYGDVTITPAFGNTEIATFDEKGALDNYTYFHMECDSEAQTCTISQIPVANRNRSDYASGWTDFKYWYRGSVYGIEVCETEYPEGASFPTVISGTCEYGLIDVYKAYYSGYKIVLAGDLDFGGYDETANNCLMQYEPFAEASFDGAGHTIKGLCQNNKSDNSSYTDYTGLVYSTGNELTVKDLVIKNPYVKDGSSDVGVVAGSVRSIVISNVRIENATVDGVANVGGLVGIAARNVKMSTIAFVGNVSGSGTTAAVGGLAGSVSKDYSGTCSFIDTYSIGVISGAYEGGLGYIVGELGADAFVNNMIGNIHYGQDAAARGIGSYSLDDWLSPSSTNIYINLRNSVEGTIDADGVLQAHQKSYAWCVVKNGSDCYKNGSIPESDMKSLRLAYILGWTQVPDENQGLPFFSEGTSYQIIHSIGFSTSEFRESADADKVKLLDDAIEDGSVMEEYCGSGCEGIALYTDHTGHLNEQDVNFVNSLLDGSSYWYSDLGEYGPSVSFSSSTSHDFYVYSSDITLNLVYRLCTGSYELDEANNIYECNGTEYEIKADQDIDGYDIAFAIKPPKSFSISDYSAMIPPMVMTTNEVTSTLLPHYYRVKPKTEDYAEVVTSFYDKTFSELTSLTNYNFETNYYDTLYVLYSATQSGALKYGVTWIQSDDDGALTDILPVYTTIAYDVEGNLKTVSSAEMASETVSMPFAHAFTVTPPVGYVLQEYTVVFGNSNTQLELDTVPATENYIVSAKDYDAYRSQRAWKKTGLTSADTITLDSIYKIYAFKGVATSGLSVSVKPVLGYVDYEINFVRPTVTAPKDADGYEVEYFVADYYRAENWTDSKTFTVESGTDRGMPQLYALGGCIGWSTGEGFVENETFLEFDDQAAAMLGYADTLYPVYFTEEQSSDVCVGAPNETSTITVHSDGNGTVELWQIIGVTDEDAGTTADTIRHTFTLDETNSTETDKVYTLTVPKAMDDDGSVIPFTFEIHGVPASSAYFLPEDGLYTLVDGGNGTTMTNIADGSSFVVDGNDQELYVKFTSYGPYFVAYDLNAAEEDLKNIYLPRGAVPTAQFTGTADMTTLPLLTPVNTERCFIGWSTAAEPADQETDIFAAMSADILYTLSADVENPTTLHAVWETCTAEKTTALTLKNGDEHSTLVVYQLFGDDILPHTVPVEGINLESASFTDGENSYTGYQFYLDQENTLPDDGYSLDLETVTLSYVVGAADPVTVNAVEGAWTVSEDGLEGVPTFTFAPSVEPLEFNLVFDVNRTGVYYGIDWTLERDGVTVTSDDSELMFPLTLKNTAACFSGWALTDDAEMGYYNLADPNFLEEIVAAEAEVVTEENDDGLLVEKPIYRLYGVWDATCEQRLYTVSTEVPVEQGFFRIYQVVDGDTIAVNVNADETATLVSSDSVQFKVAFVPATGYSLSADATVEVTYKNDTEEAVASIAAGEPYAFNDGISATKAVLSVTGLSADDYTLVFNENAATATEKPFFGDSWSDYITANTFDRDDDDNWTVSVGYSISGSTDFPMELYRNGYELMGYTFDKGDTANGLYTALTTAFIEKYVELGKEGTVNMYAYWMPTTAAEGFTVANADSADGTLVLERKFALDADSYTPVREYTVAGNLVVPSAAGNVSFTGVRFELGETAVESKILDTQMPYTVKVGEAADWTNLSGDLSVAGNTLVKSPLLNSAYEFAYSQNMAEGVNVFFNSQAWEWTASLLIGDDEGSVKLPDETALARPEACFEGWALDASGKTAYSQFDVVMLRALDSAVAAGGKVDTLYAVWNTTLSDCYPETFVVNTDMTAEKGVFAVSQHVGDAVFNYEMGEDGLVVPKLQGAELTVDFEPGPAYEMDGDIFGVTDAGDTLFSMIEGSFFTLPETIGNVSTLTLGAKLLMTTPEFALNLNAEGADVFYEDDFTSLSWTAEQYGDTIPSGIHRIDAVLEGWKLGSVESEVVYKTFGNDLMDAYNAYVEQEDHLEPVPLYAVWQADGETEPFVVTSESASEGTLVLKQVFGEDTLTYEVGESGLAVPGVQGLHFIAQFTADYEHTVAEGNPVKLMDVSGIVIDSIANGGTFAISGSTVIKVMTQEDKYELVFDANTDVILFYGTEWVAEKSYDMGNLDEDRSFPRSLYRTDACLEGFAFSKDVAATEDAYYREIDESFVEEFKSAERTAPTTLYAVWGDDCGLPYTVTTVNAAEEGSFTLVNAVGEMSNEFPVTESGLKVPYGEDLEFTVVFTPTNAYDFDGTMMMVSSDNEETELDAGAPVNFIEDTRLKAVTELHGVHFALDVKADTVFFGHDFSFNWKADKLGLPLPKNIFRSHAMLTGWSFSAPAGAANPDGYVLDPEKPIAEGDDMPLVFQYTPGVHTAYDEGFMQDYRAYVAYYGVEPDTLAAVWEEDETVETDPVISLNPEAGEFILAQDVGDSVFTYDITSDTLWIPSVPEGLEFRIMFKAAQSRVLMNDSSLSVTDNEKQSSLENGGVFVMTGGAIALAAETYFKGAHLVFNVGEEKPFFGSDWKAEGDYAMHSDEDVTALPLVLYTSEKCLAGWTTEKSDSATLYTEFNGTLMEDLSSNTDFADQKATLYAAWTDDVYSCQGGFTRVMIEQENGVVSLLDGAKEETHEFIDGSMVLPYEMNGKDLEVVSMADSSYVLDSLVLTYGFDEPYHYEAYGEDMELRSETLYEGDHLPEILDRVKFVAYFGKSNKTPVRIVEKDLAQTGNVVKLSFKASDFEVTRGVTARVQVVDVLRDSVVVSMLLGDSVAMGFECDTMIRMSRSGEYRMELTLEDELEMDEYSKDFSVKSTIDAFEADGWQMVSLAAVDTSAIDWVSGDQLFYWWDENGTGEYWQYKQFTQGDSVVATRGAWYSSLKGQSLKLRQDMEDEGSDIVWNLDSVSTGWNLVANPHGWAVDLFANRPDQKQKEVDEETEAIFYSYNAKTGDYDPVDTLKPYEAVWVQVSKQTEWIVDATPVFAPKTSEDDGTKPEEEMEPRNPALPKRVLAKSFTQNRWTLQAVLSDQRGKQDAWNILGVGLNSFGVEEPPASMGDHVNLSIMDGKRALTKSIKSSGDEMEWTVTLSASSDRLGYLTLMGIEDVKAYGYHVFVTVDGNTTEMQNGEPLKVYLKSSEKTATVRVTKAAQVAVKNTLKGLRSARLGGKLKVSFVATEDLAGTNARVDLMDMKGHVMATVTGKTVEGSNALVLDAPQTGLYMLRVRAGSAQQAGKIMVK